jgi:hypothetical protein
VTILGNYAFNECPNLTKVTIGTGVTNIGSYAFDDCEGLQMIICKTPVAPVISYSTFSGVTNDVTVFHTAGVDYSSWATLYPNMTFCPILDDVEYTSLTITAEDIMIGQKTDTVLYYTATFNAVNALTNETVTKTITGTTMVEGIPQNTSQTDSVVHTVTFEFNGKTATTTITQGAWTNDAYFLVNLNNQWRRSSDPNPDESLYEGVYESFTNKSLYNTAAIAYVDITGYDEFSLYIRSYGENNNDYVMVSELDKTIINSTSYSDTTLVKAHTRGISTSGTDLSNYTKVTWTGIGGGTHRITVLYRTSGFNIVGDNQGYMFIPKQQS